MRVDLGLKLLELDLLHPQLLFVHADAQTLDLLGHVVEGVGQEDEFERLVGLQAHIQHAERQLLHSGDQLLERLEECMPDKEHIQGKDKEQPKIHEVCRFLKIGQPLQHIAFGHENIDREIRLSARAIDAKEPFAGLLVLDELVQLRILWRRLVVHCRKMIPYGRNTKPHAILAVDRRLADVAVFPLYGELIKQLGDPDDRADVHIAVRHLGDLHEKIASLHACVVPEHPSPLCGRFIRLDDAVQIVVKNVLHHRIRAGRTEKYILSAINEERVDGVIEHDVAQQLILDADLRKHVIVTAIWKGRKQADVIVENARSCSNSC